MALIQAIKTELHTLADVSNALSFIFVAPHVDTSILTAEHKQVAALVKENLDQIDTPETFVTTLKQEAKKQKIPLAQLFWFLRMALMGKEHGPAIHELIAMLGSQERGHALRSYCFKASNAFIRIANGYGETPSLSIASYPAAFA